MTELEAWRADPSGRWLDAGSPPNHPETVSSALSRAEPGSESTRSIQRTNTGRPIRPDSSAVATVADKDWMWGESVVILGRRQARQQSNQFGGCRSSESGVRYAGAAHRASVDGLVIASVYKGDKGLLSKYDTSFQVESLQTFHLALGGAYREDYRRDEVASATDRFEFKTG